MKKCMDCGEEISNNAKRCKKCSRKEHSCFMMNNNYFKGHKHKISSLKLMSQHHIKLFGDKNPNFKGKNICPICKNIKIYKSKICIKCYHKKIKIKLPNCINCGKELSCKISIRCHSCEQKRRLNSSNFKKYFSSKIIKYKDIKMRSYWEVAYAKYLDRNNIKWLYEPKVFNLKIFSYIPDFYLPETDEYIEIKGLWRRKSKEKIELFKKLYPNEKISVLFKENLKNMKLIDSSGREIKEE